MSTETDVDIAALVGPFEPTPCEHSQHTVEVRWHDGGAATHYMAAGCPYCHKPVMTIAICEKFTNFIRANGPMFCTECGYTGFSSELSTILGPVPTNA